MSTCAKNGCAVHLGLPCEMGDPAPTTCVHFNKPSAEDARNEPGHSSREISGFRLPWTGRALGLNDLILVGARTKPSLVGLVGPFDAGKTSLLTAIFVRLGLLGAVGDYLFAGSYSLQAWNNLKSYTEWPSASGPLFPPHTADSGERVPGILHLAFRQNGFSIRDVLFTDAPGEWFDRWMRNQDADNAAGARWIVDNASHFIFLVDRSALASANVGRARQSVLALARLLAEHKHGRPVITVWTKSDLAVASDVEEPIRKKLLELFGMHRSFDLSVTQPECLKVLAEVLTASQEPKPVAQSNSVKSAFLAYRGEPHDD